MMKFNIKIPTYQVLTIFLIILSIWFTAHSQILNASFVGCSTIYCSNCTNSYQCGTCMYDQTYCCPRFCLKCLSMGHCVKCQEFFMLVSINQSIACKRISISTDPNIINQTTCNPGFYLQPVLSSCFSCNFPNCRTCSGYQVCQNCSAGYFYWINSTQLFSQFQSSSCLPCIQNCQNCLNPLQCIVCYPQYFIKLNTCQQCNFYIPYCIFCKNQTYCQNCQAYAYLVQLTGQCKLCSQYISNCFQCYDVTKQQQGTKCIQCQTGYSLAKNSTECMKCISNCQSCNENGSCSVCDDFYILKGNNTCVKCGNYCKSCSIIDSATNNCTQCIFGYILTSASAYNNQSQILACTPCPFPCKICVTGYNSTLSNNTCLQCYPKFFLDQPQDQFLGQCYFCNIKNCLKCISSTACTLCENGYYLKQIQINSSSSSSTFINSTMSTLCFKCPNSCTSCIFGLSPTSNNFHYVNCTSCQFGFTLQIQNNNYMTYQFNISRCLPCGVQFCSLCQPFSPNFEQFCLSCNPGYFPYFGFKICVNCSIQNCQYCSNTSLGNSTFGIICNECQQGFYLSFEQNTTQQCFACPQNCVVCVNGTVCSQCLMNFYLIAYFNDISLSNNQSCNPCPLVCKTCDAKGCLACQDGLYSDNLQPSQYEPNTDLNIQCFQCNLAILGCIQCLNSFYCEKCSSVGFFQIPTIYGNCSACPQGCLICDETLVCSQCIPGYIIDTSANLCLFERNMPFWAWFIIFTLGFAVIFVISQHFLRYFKNKKKINKIIGVKSQVTQFELRSITGKDLINKQKNKLVDQL